jgi:hypothetical protein
MEILIKGIGKKIKEMDKELVKNQTEKFILVNGCRISDMEKE